MKLGKIRICAILLTISLLIFGACSSHSQDTQKRTRVGVVCYNQSDTYIRQLTNCLKNQLDQLELTMMLRDAAGSQRTQDDQVKELLDAGCGVLCVNLVDRADPSEIIDLAREHDVPIIFFNREPVAEDLMQWDQLYYVGADAKQAGQMQGELAAAAILAKQQADRNHDGKIQYVVLEGEPGHQDSIIRTEYAVNTLKNKGIQLEKLSCQIANWNRAQAQNRMMQMISQHQNQIELVLANNDDMALGAVDAYKKLNVTESALPIFLGIDGTDVGLDAVINGTLTATVYNNKEAQAKAIARLAASLSSGQKIDKTMFEKENYLYLPYFKVTADNADQFVRQE